MLMLINKAKELFSRKIKSDIPPSIIFSDNIVSQANSQKHLGLTFDFKLTFE